MRRQTRSGRLAARAEEAAWLRTVAAEINSDDSTGQVEAGDDPAGTYVHPNGRRRFTATSHLIFEELPDGYWVLLPRRAAVKPSVSRRKRRW